MAGASGKEKHRTLPVKLEAMRMLETGSLASAVMPKFGDSSRFVTKLVRVCGNSRDIWANAQLF